MQTLLTSSPEKAAAILNRGGLVAFPTETVYGLGADVFDEDAVKNIFLAKGRPSDNPLIAHVGRVEDIDLVASHITPHAARLVETFFPAPLTLVLPKHKNVPLIATANLQTIGVRMPHHEMALEFLRACRSPVVAPSANLSGKPSPTTWQAVYEDLNGRIDAILQGDATQVGLESTVVDCTSDAPLILRAGAISLEALQSVVPQTRLYQTKIGEAPRSPGLKHRHYSPQAKVVLINAPDEAIESKNHAYIGLSPVEESAFGAVKRCADLEEYARELYAFFRACDHQNIQIIFCQRVDEAGLGLALCDRLRRAASS
jgi:L-threonylcarbamoyladenylate synthase